jgi:hypothetical protein
VRRTLYIQFRSNWIRAKDISKQRVIETSTEVTTDAKGRIVELGLGARTTAAQVRNGFEPGCRLISDLDLASRTLAKVIGRLMDKPLFVLKPDVVLHPLEVPHGGISELEYLGLRNLAFDLGVWRVIIHEGRDLTDDEVRSVVAANGTFPGPRKRRR